MDSGEKRKAQRFLFLRRLYETVDANPLVGCNFRELGGELGWDEATTNNIVDYLRDERLIRTVTFVYAVITHEGIKAMEYALSNPDQPTPYFPRANFILVVSGNFVIDGDVVGRDQSTTNVAGGDFVGRDKLAPNDTSESQP